MIKRFQSRFVREKTPYSPYQKKKNQIRFRIKKADRRSKRKHVFRVSRF